MPQKYRVEITASAETDIAGIWDYISQDDPDSAVALIRRLEEQICTLEVSPERSPLVPENEFLGTDYRHLLLGNYRTVFKIISARLIILRVIHGHGARLLDTELLEGW